MAHHYPNLDFCPSAPNLADIAEAVQATFVHLAKSRQMIAESKRLILKVDRAIENDKFVMEPFRLTYLGPRALHRMDPKKLMYHLAQSEERIAKGRVHVNRQLQIVDELVRNGEDARKSKDC